MCQNLQLRLRSLTHHSHPLSLEHQSLDFRGSLALPTLPPVLSLPWETGALPMTSDCPPVRDDGPLGAGWDQSLLPPEVGCLRLSSAGSAQLGSRCPTPSGDGLAAGRAYRRSGFIFMNAASSIFVACYVSCIICKFAI